MFGIELNSTVIKEAARIITKLAGIQTTARKKLITEVTAICSKCDDAYTALLERLEQVKGTYRDPDKLAVELRKLKADAKVRSQFKPEKLCAEIDHLLDNMSSMLSTLPYSVNVLSIGELKRTLQSMGNYDAALYHQYDVFMDELESIGKAIETTKNSGRKELASFASDKIADLEKSLKTSISAIRTAKNQVTKIM